MLLKDHLRPVSNFHYITTSTEEIIHWDVAVLRQPAYWPHYLKIQLPISYSQEPVIGHYPVPEEPGLHPPSLFLGDHFNILHPPTCRGFGVTRKFNGLLPVTYL
jgi:hypothetical protein